MAALGLVVLPTEGDSLGAQVVLLLAVSAAAAACLLVFVPRHWQGRPLGFFVAMGVALQLLLAIPVGMYQGVVLVDKSKPLVARLAMGGIAAPFHMGGWTVRQVFDKVAKPVPQTPKRVVIPKAIAQFPLFLMLLAVQVGVLAGAFAWRMRERQTFKDPVILGLGAAVLVNSVANAGWVWWK